MIFENTELDGVQIITPEIHHDERGHFLEVYRKNNLLPEFVQDNIVGSKQRVLRGLHYQPNQGKLMMAITGTIFQVAVDVRPGSLSFGKWTGRKLTVLNKEMIYIPPGFLTGTLALSEWTDLFYKVTDYYDPDKSVSVIWNDPDIGITWPIDYPILKEKDANARYLKELFTMDRFDDLVLYLDAKAEFKGNVLTRFAKQFDLRIFVETGTYSGKMIEFMNASHKFDRIYSIELSPRLYERAKQLFVHDKNVTILQGDSSEVLKSFTFTEPALFWLDAHYSCGCTARGRKITPVMEELEIILNDIDHVIVIDDLDNLPKWGVTIDGLRQFVLSHKPNVFIEIIDNMMVVVPG
jgi:dTDP-4-dehydrorhamnose 3,5-epimerase